ncbi:hypothetical protein O6H91_20G074000 [Diphasiastrum complanatum]|uniref:Uncharacterized protein n=1 Tax=Diphasiastrum complanatum TaxID=34168 RepID=A0ACC2ART6_DIPCM|nr:hypothetical protein O6H91_20G074000 [Diphasiastrum complanatum]
MEDYNKIKTSEARRLEKWAGKECNMCGDVGFYEELFRCTRCQARYQHTYCSITYPNLAVDHRWICDWCSHVGRTVAVKHQKMKTSRRKNKHSIKAQWCKSIDALELLLVVGQSILRGEVIAADGSVHQQEVNQQQELRKLQCSTLKEKSKLGVDEFNRSSKNPFRLKTSSKGIARRYRLLSDF